MPRPVPAPEVLLRRTALQVSALSSFLATFLGSAVNLALPAIGREFHLPAVSLGWVATVYLVATVVFLLPFGRIADLRGRKWVLQRGMALLCAASLACALAPTGGWLLAFRAAQGLGGAMVFAPSLAILTAVFPREERGRVLGLSVSATYLGLSLGPVLGGLLTQHLGWRSIFVVVLLLGLAVLGLIAARLHGEWAEERGGSFDGVGAALLGGSLAALSYGLSRLPGAGGAFWLTGALLGLAGFVLWEARQRHPLLEISLFTRNRVFAFSTVAALINYSATFAVSFLLSFYLQYVKALPPQHAGLLLVAQPIVMAAGSPLAGRLSDRWEPGVVASAGMAITVAGLLLLTRLDAGSTLAAVVAGQLVLGLGFALFSSPNTNAVMGAVEPRTYGVASATLSTMRLTGQMFSLALTLLLLAWFVGDVHLVPGTFPAYLRAQHTAFWLFAGLCAFGVFASLARGRRGARP